MSRENGQWCTRIEAIDNVSIRSRLDEPGERRSMWNGTSGARFQSAPGSMSRENPMFRRHV